MVTEQLLKIRLAELFIGRTQQHKRCADGTFFLCGHGNFQHHAVGRRLDLGDHLIGFNHHQRLALGNGLAFLLQPLDDLAFFHRMPKAGHTERDGHHPSP